MKKIIKGLQNNNGAVAMLVNGFNILPFAGIALLLCSGTASTVFGIIFLILGLTIWGISEL